MALLPSDFYFSAPPGVSCILPYLLTAVRHPVLVRSYFGQLLSRARLRRRFYGKTLIAAPAPASLMEIVQVGHLHQLMRNRPGQQGAGSAWLTERCGASLGDFVSFSRKGKTVEMRVDHVIVGRSKKLPDGFVMLSGPATCSKVGYLYPDRTQESMLPARLTVRADTPVTRLDAPGAVLQSLFRLQVARP